MTETHVVYEQLERVKYARREFYYVGETTAEIEAAMEWVRSKGHEARHPAADGFLYRSVYVTPCDYTGRRTSHWRWVEAGEWLTLMEGDGQDSEFDDSTREDPGDVPEPYVYGQQQWHRVEVDR